MYTYLYSGYIKPIYMDILHSTWLDSRVSTLSCSDGMQTNIKLIKV